MFLLPDTGMPMVHLPQQLSQKALLQLLKPLASSNTLPETSVLVVKHCSIHGGQLSLDVYGDVLKKQSWVVAKVFQSKKLELTLRNHLLLGARLEESDSSLLTRQISQNPRGIVIKPIQQYAQGNLEMFGFDSCSPNLTNPMEERPNLDEDKGRKRFVLLRTSVAKLAEMHPFCYKADLCDDYAGCHEHRRSTSGFSSFLGHRLVRWSSKVKSMPISPTEVNSSPYQDVVLQILMDAFQLRDYGL
ncbi:hypothetical protein Tco_0655997 [Tanacetum coccineum]|uniref:Inositol-1,3,4-trisphosphate 5/6-kinase n=1 Tax=Tanacetum coccineum TaxID=301880 RepID=A0ABQ4X7J6_9ASTR